MAIITATEYKTYAGITASTWDTVLANLVTAMQKRLERHLGRVFDSATYNPEYHNGIDSPEVYVKNPPITTLTSVTVYDDEGDGTALASTDYDSNTDKVVLRGSYFVRRGVDSDGLPGVPGWSWSPRFREGFKRIGIVYVGGYSSGTTPFPDDLKQLMYELVDTAFAARRRDPSLQSERLGEYQWTAAEIESAFKLFAARARAWEVGGVR